MRTITVTTTIEVNAKATSEEIYDVFRGELQETVDTGDLTAFTFLEELEE